MWTENEPFSSAAAEDKEKEYGDDEQEQDHAARHQHGCMHGGSPVSVRLCMHVDRGMFKPISRTSKHNGQGVVRRGDYQLAIGARS